MLSDFRTARSPAETRPFGGPETGSEGYIAGRNNQGTLYSQVHFSYGQDVRISIFGLGYVGAVSLATLARDGHLAIGVDIDADKLALIRAGRSPVVEEGMQELVQTSVASGRAQVTNSAAEAVANSELSFICVGTPSLPNGSQDQSAIISCIQQIGAALAEQDSYHVVVVRSTVEPGTLRKVLAPLLERHSGKSLGEDFGLCFQPEFLREGSSIRDYDNPPFTVVGGDSDRAIAKVREIFGHLPAEFITTTIENAEMLKYACNSFHALKITFANEIGRVSQALGVDAREVMMLLCKDTQLNISPAYLRPGFAFGGSCLPKDVRALTYLARSRDVHLPTLESILPSNELHIQRAVDRVLQEGRQPVALVGLSFKSGTDDLRESPLVSLAESLIGKGFPLRIYDPQVSLSRLLGANRSYIEQAIPHIASLLISDLDELLAEAKIIVIGIADAKVRQALSEHIMDDQLIIDLTGTVSPDATRGRYHGMCW